MECGAILRRLNAYSHREFGFTLMLFVDSDSQWTSVWLSPGRGKLILRFRASDLDAGDIQVATPMSDYPQQNVITIC